MVLPDQGQKTTVTYIVIFKTSFLEILILLTYFMFSTTLISEVCYAVSERHGTKKKIELPSEPMRNIPLIRDTHLSMSASLWEIK